VLVVIDNRHSISAGFKVGDHVLPCAILSIRIGIKRARNHVTLAWKLELKFFILPGSHLYFLDCLQSPIFRKIVRIERLPVRTAILVWYVPRGRASGFKAVGERRREQYISPFLPNHPLPLSCFDTHPEIAALNAKCSISTILWENRGTWTVYYFLSV